MIPFTIEFSISFFSVISALGATVSSIALYDITGAIDLYALGAGEKAKLGTVTYA